MADLNFLADATDLQIPITELKNVVIQALNDGDLMQASSVAQFTRGCSIKMRRSNTGMVYVGSKNVNANNGYELAAGESVALSVNDLSLVWFKFEKAGDKAAVMYGK